MEETRFYQKPWFYIVSRGVIMLALYGIAIYYQWKGNTFNPITIFVDIGLFIILLLIWMAFFAQFILPVQTFTERQKIFGRLLDYLGGTRGPAIFIKNGQVIERAGESDRKGHGVLWLDSASGAVTHTDVSLKNTFGPGVHFTEGGEKIAATVDLHTQVQSIGPRDKDRPFEAQGSTSDDAFNETQRRRSMVSALTRDGIEVVPNISVVFKIDADPIKGDQPGSHFGYNEDAVRKAIINQAINPNAKPHTLEYNVAWNELPASIAADLWREYMSKFRLKQLFETDLVAPAQIPLPKHPLLNEDTEAFFRPIIGRKRDIVTETATAMLHDLNYWLGKIADRCENEKEKKKIAPPYSGGGGKPPDFSKKTALQVINFMLKERMTNPFVSVVDRDGQNQEALQRSEEFRILQERGIRVMAVSVSNLCFPPKVEEQLISQWTANWLVNARNEHERILSRQRLSTLDGQEKAIKEYADALSADFAAISGRKDTLKTLILRSRDVLIRNDRIHRRATSELESIAEILQWLEEN